MNKLEDYIAESERDNGNMVTVEVHDQETFDNLCCTALRWPDSGISISDRRFALWSRPVDLDGWHVVIKLTDSDAPLGDFLRGTARVLRSALILALAPLGIPLAIARKLVDVGRKARGCSPIDRSDQTFVMCPEILAATAVMLTLDASAAALVAWLMGWI